MKMLTDIEIYRSFIEGEPALHLLVAASILLFIATAAHFFVKLVLRRFARILAPRLGDIASALLHDDGLFSRLALFFPTLIIYQGVSWLPLISPTFVAFLQKCAVIAAIAIGLSTIARILFKGNEIYSLYPVSRSRPIKGYLQVTVIVMYAVGFLIAIATALDKSPLVLVSGLGAMTAILLLVFRDTLLSLVAGVQLTTNGLIQVGDWIEMPQFGADGSVVDIALHVVKVQNWDNTITMIPTHKFLENSFKNWRGMSESGGRRIKRSVFIDINTVRFLDDNELDRYSEFALLGDYVKTKRKELAAFNGEDRDAGSVLTRNTRKLTNIGTFRAYLTSYLRQHPDIHQDMTFIIRQLQPTSEGIPMEIYVFTRDVRWSFHEATQSDIFDHILSILGEFDLRVFQKPSGQDFHGLAAKEK